MAPGETARVDSLTLDLEWQLASIPLSIRRLEAHGADLHLVREADGHANWHMNPEGPGKGPPLIKSLEVPDARVELHDARRHVDFKGTVSALDRTQDGQVQGLRIEGRGTLNGREASFTLDGDALVGVRRDRPYHFAARENSGSANLSAEGVLSQPFDMRTLEATFAISGADMSDTYYLVGLRLPVTGAFHLRGRLERNGKRFVYRDLAAKSGGSDIGGTLTVDSSSGRPKIEGAMKSRMLRLADFGNGAAERDAPAPAGTDAGAPASAAPLPLAALGRSDWRVSFEAQELQLGSEDLKSVTAAVSVEAWRLLRLEASCACTGRRQHCRGRAVRCRREPTACSPRAERQGTAARAARAFGFPSDHRHAQRADEAQRRGQVGAGALEHGQRYRCRIDPGRRAAQPRRRNSRSLT